MNMQKSQKSLGVSPKPDEQEEFQELNKKYKNI